MRIWFRICVVLMSVHTPCSFSVALAGELKYEQFAFSLNLSNRWQQKHFDSSEHSLELVMSDADKVASIMLVATRTDPSDAGAWVEAERAKMFHWYASRGKYNIEILKASEQEVRFQTNNSRVVLGHGVQYTLRVNGHTREVRTVYVQSLSGIRYLIFVYNQGKHANQDDAFDEIVAGIIVGE